MESNIINMIGKSSSTRNMIGGNLGSDRKSKRQISATVSESNLKRLKAISKEFSKITGIRHTQNQLIEEAIRVYTEASANTLLNDHNIDIDNVEG